MVHGLTADKKKTKCMGNKEILKIILCNNHYYLNFKVGLSDDSKK